MSTLNIDENTLLLRAKFTQREISTQERKFYNLFRLNPFMTFEIEQHRKLREQHDDLLAALRMFCDASKNLTLAPDADVFMAMVDALGHGLDAIAKAEGGAA